MAAYSHRIVDDELDELLPELAAVAVEGPKGVGKTATARRRAQSVIALDDPEQLRLMEADPDRINRAEGTILVDEWQRHPEVWDRVRRSVDLDPRPGRYILAGSAAPSQTPMHSGAGRIVQVRMRPMSLAERGLETPTVSLAQMLGPQEAHIDGETRLGAPDYVEEILGSGFPGIRPLPARARRAQIDGYLARIVERDFSEQGHRVRNPATLRAWLAAYAAATATTAAYNAILDAATPGESHKPAKSTTTAYRDVLGGLWLLDPIPGWTPTDNPLGRLAMTPKHHLADPALAAQLLDLDADTILAMDSSVDHGAARGSTAGPLFESLVALSLQSYAQVNEVKLYHLRTRNADHEIDFIAVGRGGRVVALEVKLARSVADRDTKHLHWLRSRLGDRVADAAVITSGPYAYRREDGIAVVPASLLGP